MTSIRIEFKLRIRMRKTRESEPETPAKGRRRKNKHWGGLVGRVVELSGKTKWAVYAVLNERIASGPIQQAIDQYHREIEETLPKRKRRRK